MQPSPCTGLDPCCPSPMGWMLLLPAPGLSLVWAEPKLSLTPMNGCCVIYSRDAELGDRRVTMVTHHLCGCPNTWQRSFPVLEPQLLWEKVWKLSLRDLYRLNHHWTWHENLCRSHISPLTLLKWIGRVWSELRGIFSIFSGYIQRSKYFGIWGKA